MIDWLARTAMLVLAALATLALIGSLASVSNSSVGDAFPGTIQDTPVPPESQARPPGEMTVTRAPDGGLTIDQAPQPEIVRTPEQPRDREIARWLKALTYAVLALAAVAAAGVVALVRIGSRMQPR